VKRVLPSLCVLLAAGCATASKDISPTYASPLLYDGYSCEQVAAESTRVDSQASALGKRLDEAAQHDKGILVTGLLFFWPALFALGGTQEEEAEYARLKGEHAALLQTAAAKGCGAQEAQASTRLSEPPRYRVF
jgi:hypothetical protein